ncbi:conserved hypothetical protein, secreted [Candidatus Magnetomorum sp. HK-1]|nr:conserved hypothetical protein, secreted [Candidatus Magnetomorum sp. HK-1]
MKYQSQMKHKLFWISLILFIFLLYKPFVFAQIPEHIHFQGMLTNKEGLLVNNGQHVLHFSIFEQKAISQKNQALWNERHLVTVENGIYSVLLGSNTPFSDPDENPKTNDGLSFANPYFLDITYNNSSLAKDGQLFPLTSVWTAFRAKSVAGRLVTSVENKHEILGKDDILLAKGGAHLTLPKAFENRGKMITIKKSDVSNLGVRIICQGKDRLIAPQTENAEKCPITLTQPLEDITLISDGNTWWGMGQGKVMVESQDEIPYARLQLKDAIQATDIQDRTITHVDISPEAEIAYHQLNLDQSIQGSDISNNAIQSVHILDNTITNNDIASSAEISYSKLNLRGSIKYSDLSTNVVDTKAIINGTITNEDISEKAKIKYNKLNLVRAIQHRDLKSNAVDSDIIQNQTIRNVDIAENARIQYKKLDLTDSIQTIDIKDQTIIPSKLNHVQSMGKNNQALMSDGEGGFQWKDMNVLDNVYVVGPGSSYQTIGDAMTEIKSHRRPVLIKIGPGIYNEQLITRPNMCIEGSGQNVTTIRFTGGSQGNASSATVVGYTNVELRNLTIISNASRKKNENAIGLFNPASIKVRHVTIKVYGGTAYNYGIYNDRSIPVINHVHVSVRSTVTEESWNYGIYNETSNAHIDNVNIQAWGGDRTFGIANKSSFPVIYHTHVTASAGVMKNRGIWNESSSPRISFSEVIVSGVCHDNYGIENYNNSSPIIKNSMIKAFGLTSYGLYQWGSSQDSIKIYSSNISGETHSIYGSSAKFLLAHSQIEGEVTGKMTCISSFNKNFLPLDHKCQQQE